MKSRHFNSQPHEEADFNAVAYDEYISIISTRSLTRRLTKWLEFIQYVIVFQLAASRGG